MLKRLTVSALLALLTACGSEVDLEDEDQAESYAEGWAISTQYPPKRGCDDILDEYRDIMNDNLTYELSEDAFILGCKDLKQGKMPQVM